MSRSNASQLCFNCDGRSTVVGASSPLSGPRPRPILPFNMNGRYYLALGLAEQVGRGGGGGTCLPHTCYSLLPATYLLQPATYLPTPTLQVTRLPLVSRWGTQGRYSHYSHARTTLITHLPSHSPQMSRTEITAPTPALTPPAPLPPCLACLPCPTKTP